MQRPSMMAAGWVSRADKAARDSIGESSMTEDRSRHTQVGNHALHPETLMLGFGYDPARSEGAVKPPIFLTSTFVFQSAEEGRDFFDVAAGRKPAPPGGAGLVYSRFNHPNAEIAEDRLAIYEGCERALVFASGMGAISTTVLAYCRPGDAILHSQPLYGGTETLFARTMAAWSVHAEGFTHGLDAGSIEAAADRAAAKGRVGLIFVETPSNPMNSLVDFQLIGAARDRIAQAQGQPPLIVCDNTMLGPIFQAPLRHGVDIVVYSLTKYIGGHSDLVAGAALGSREALRPVQAMRGAIGTQLDPHSSWMIGRSLETLSLRMRAAAGNAEIVAGFLAQHARIARVFSLGGHGPDAAANAVYARQCTGAGSTFSVTLRGGQSEAFRVLNALRVFKLAVSLGGTESLASHPASTTHSGVPAEVRAAAGVTDGLIRLSIGIEHPDDLVADLAQALAMLESPP